MPTRLRRRAQRWLSGRGKRLPLSGLTSAAYWSEDGCERTELLGLVIAYLTEHRWGKRSIPAGPTGTWRFIVIPWTVVQVCTAQEEHGGQRRLIRVRFQLRFSNYTRVSAPQAFLPPSSPCSFGPRPLRAGLLSRLLSSRMVARHSPSGARDGYLRSTGPKDRPDALRSVADPGGYAGPGTALESVDAHGSLGARPVCAVPPKRQGGAAGTVQGRATRKRGSKSTIGRRGHLGSPRLRPCPRTAVSLVPMINGKPVEEDGRLHGPGSAAFPVLFRAIDENHRKRAASSVETDLCI